MAKWTCDFSVFEIRRDDKTVAGLYSYDAQALLEFLEDANRGAEALEKLTAENHRLHDLSTRLANKVEMLLVQK